MKKTVKFISLALSLIMMCSFLSACGQNNTNVDFEIASKEELDPAKIGDYSTLKLPIDKNGTKIEVMCNTDVTSNNDSVVIKELRRRTGLDVQILAVPAATYSQKAKVIIASQDQMPDLMYMGTFTIADTNDFGGQGAFANVLEYKNDLPNFKKIYIDEAKERKIEGGLKNLMDAEGRLFVFPTYDINRDVNHGMLYRKDIFDKHGIEMWTDQESFLNVLRELKKLYPSSTPFVSKTNTTIIRDLGYSWGLNGFKPYYDEETGKWKYSCTDAKYKEVLDFIKTMYREGLLDPEFITTTQAAWTQKMTQRDKAFVTWDWIDRMDMFKEQTKETIPEYDLRYGYPVGGKVITLARTGTGVAAKKGKNELLALKLCDYLLSDSGAQLMSMGIEGVTYNLREDGKAEYVGHEGEIGVTTTELEADFGLCIPGFYRRFDRRCAYYDFTERKQEAQDLMNNKPGGGFMPYDPEVSLTPEETEITSEYITQISKAAEEFSTKYILDEKYGEKEWNEWLEKAKTLGTDIVIEQYNKAQARYDAL